MIGRLSGDEFAVVAPGFSDKYEEKMKKHPDRKWNRNNEVFLQPLIL